MATLHFIWWGPFNPASCERAKEIVNKIGPTPITFWCKQPEVPRYRYAMLGFSSITVRSCSSLRDLAGARYAADRSWFDRAQGVVDQMSQYRAFAAVKDLLSFAILYSHGGYYVDTTVQFSPNEDGSKLKRQLARDTNHARIAQRTEPGVVQPHVIGFLPPERIARGWAPNRMPPVESGMDTKRMLEEPAKQLVTETASIDVWCMYSPPGDAVMLLALQSYVNRATTMGLFTGATQGMGREIMTKPKSPKEIGDMPSDPPMQPGPLDPPKPKRRAENLLIARNDLIGQLAIRSALDAFLGAGAKDFRIPFHLDTYYKEDEFGRKRNAGKGVLDDFGMEKIFGVSGWRKEIAGTAVPVVPAPATGSGQ